MRKKSHKFTYSFSLRKRYKVIIAIFVMITLIFSAIQLYYMEKIFTVAAKNSMISMAKDIESLDLNSDDFAKDISDIETNKGIYVEIYSPRDTLIYTTSTNSFIYGSDPDKLETMMPRQMRILTHRDLKDGSFFEEREEFYAEATFWVYEYTIDDSTIVVFHPKQTIADNARTASINLLYLSAAFAITAITLTLMYNREIILPVERINATTKKIARMDFSERIPNFRIFDLDELGQSVNLLSSSLQKNLNSLRETNIRLIEDIEREKHSIETRKQFIANASHELKTPIAIIESYAEGIKYCESKEEIEEYTDVIIDETEKMTDLITRLLTLVKYDNQNYVPDFADFDISSWIHSFLKPLKLSFDSKNINIETNIDDGLIGYGNEYLLTEVLSNYISNAVSHCKENTLGEKIIRISAKQNKDIVEISVYNSGSRINDDDIIHIWENFYRADKSHSRAEGRFGLGLSIVKSIQEIHNQSYGVENVEDGVVFRFNIKKGG